MYYYCTKQGGDLLLIAVYVDDILPPETTDSSKKHLSKHLSSKFEVKDLGEIKYCLGIEFSRDNSGISMNQRGYIKDNGERFGMSNSKPISTLLSPGLKLKKGVGLSKFEYEDLPYRELIGALMYLAVCTRPDIAYTVYLS